MNSRLTLEAKNIKVARCLASTISFHPDTKSTVSLWNDEARAITGIS